MRGIVEILAILAGVYLLVSGLLLTFQDRLAFPGLAYPLPSPEAAGVARADTVSVTTSDGVTLHGWYLHPVPAPEDGRLVPGLLWFCGNMEAVGALAPILEDLRPPGTAVLALDYRGYGSNGGRPSEPGLYRDAEAAWSYLSRRPEVDADRISVYGRSLGSVPALFLAERHTVRSVVLDSPFTSARAMAAKHYWYLPRFFLRLRLDNLGRARRLRSPLLVFHGSADDIVPVRMGQAVTDAGRGKLVVFDGAGHNDLYEVAGAGYREEMLAFLNREP